MIQYTETFLQFPRAKQALKFGATMFSVSVLFERILPWRVETIVILLKSEKIQLPCSGLFSRVLYIRKNATVLTYLEPCYLEKIIAIPPVAH